MDNDPAGSIPLPNFCGERNEWLEKRRLALELAGKLECLPVAKRPRNKHLDDAESRWGSGTLDKDLRSVDPKDQAPGCDFFMYRSKWEDQERRRRTQAQASTAHSIPPAHKTTKRGVIDLTTDAPGPPAAPKTSKKPLWTKASALPGGLSGPPVGQAQPSHTQEEEDYWSPEIDVIFADYEDTNPPVAGRSEPAPGPSRSAAVPAVPDLVPDEDDDDQDELEWNEWFDRMMVRVHEEFAERLQRERCRRMTGKGKGRATDR
ncbi:hypothetical protein CALVIDRAFT_529955 [Calocera viscosa TUFC12733]|uniref:Uncharacterized protein n=1 Tax=Calocera viscosa (strain TUFC12733) TaxID=1330018 RepID=A0A167IP89_CALVF|nr:hypothetical protein CALVIDRAFT_529955 [Calocera viscosa TUFC12733]